MLLEAYRRMKLERTAKRQQKIYANRIQRYRHHHEMTHWTTARGQWTRFAVLKQDLELRKKIIADIGCGVGDFFRYLKSEHVIASMHGFDITKSFVEYAQGEHPDCWFYDCNVAVDGLPREYDYSFSSGLFAFGDRIFFEIMVKKIFAKTRYEYRFNMFQTQSKNFWSISPEQAKAYCESLGDCEVSIITGYLGRDYTVCMKRIA
ncbi:MAG: class I SAM-dependent methyltransferase [Oligoflexales bacterium]